MSKNNLPATEADEPINCPHCKASLLSNPIPEEERMYHSGNYFKREIGIEYPEKYDGVWHFECPDCKGKFGGVEGVIK